MTSRPQRSSKLAVPQTAPTLASRPLSVVDQVTESILELILTGRLAPSEIVSIQDLSERLGVSHIPVRESLRGLESRGLVNFRRGKRPQIAPADPQDFKQMFRLRSVIEADVASRSPRLLTTERIEALEGLFAEMRSTLLGGSASLVYPVHTNFHLTLLAGASRWDLQMLEQLWVATERYIQLYLSAVERDDQALEMIVDHHGTVLEAARRPTAAKLRRAVVDHINFSYEMILPAILAASGQQ